MPFPVLDACLHLYAGEKMSPHGSGDGAGVAVSATHRPSASQAWAARFTAAVHAVDLQVGAVTALLHVGSLDLDRERALQMPVVQKNEWAK